MPASVQYGYSGQQSRLFLHFFPLQPTGASVGAGVGAAVGDVGCLVGRLVGGLVGCVGATVGATGQRVVPFFCTKQSPLQQYGGPFLPQPSLSWGQQSSFPRSARSPSPSPIQACWALPSASTPITPNAATARVLTRCILKQRPQGPRHLVEALHADLRNKNKCPVEVRCPQVPSSTKVETKLHSRITRPGREKRRAREAQAARSGGLADQGESRVKESDRVRCRCLLRRWLQVRWRCRQVRRRIFV